jgi:hypothetical protein
MWHVQKSGDTNSSFLIRDSWTDSLTSTNGDDEKIMLEEIYLKGIYLGISTLCSYEKVWCGLGQKEVDSVFLNHRIDNSNVSPQETLLDHIHV